MMIAGGVGASERWSHLTDRMFQNFGMDNGSPLGTVTALAQDQSGYLWLGTLHGLARFDGYRFHFYKPDDGRAGALPDGVIVSLHVDRHGRLWVGTNSAGLARYDAVTDRFTVIGAGEAGLAHARVRVIADEGEDGLWVGTEGGLDHLDIVSGRISHFRHDPRDAASLPDDRVRALLTDPAGALWVGTVQGLARKGLGADGFSRVPLPIDNGDSALIWSLLRDSSGRMWIGTRNQGVFVIRAGAATAEAVVAAAATDDVLGSDSIAAMIEVVPGRIWLGSNDRGIVEIDGTTLTAHHITHEARPTSLAHNRVTSLLTDSSGLVWVGSFAGLSRHDPGSEAVVNVQGGGDLGDRPRDSNVYSIAVVPGSGIWLGLESRGVDILDPDAGRVGQFVANSLHPESALPNTAVSVLAPTADGVVYAGTENGLYRLDRAGGLRRVGLPDRLAHASVIAILPDGPDLWLGTNNGLWRVDPARPQAAVRFAEHELTDQVIRTIVKDRDGALWVGTRNGLCRLDARDGTVERIQTRADDAASLGGNHVVKLLFDDRGRLWVGTSGSGISILEGRDPMGRPRFTRLGPQQGLPDDVIGTLLADRRGRIWASTDNGIAVIDAKTLAIHSLGAADGLAITSYWQNSGAVTAEGELLFGGSGGLMVIHPDLLRSWDFRPPIVATEIRVGGKLVPVNRPVVVAPDANSLAVEFAALDFSAPERNRYAYRLEGFDRDWIMADASRRLATYTNLAPGRYQLRIRGSNRNGEWTDTVLTLPVLVTPAWYQTAWFWMAIVALSTGSVMALIRLRTRQLRLRQKELEQIVRERTAELVEKNAQLEKLSISDRLTGLFNRRHLDEVLHGEFARSRRSGSPFSAILLDVDHFKAVNDIHGHQVGDQVLEALAGVLADNRRETDIVGRWGGEEFLILCPHTPTDGAVTLAENLRRAVAAHEFPVVGRKTVSLGVATLNDFENVNGLIGRADAALYEAKRKGRDRVEMAV